MAISPRETNEQWGNDDRYNEQYWRGEQNFAIPPARFRPNKQSGDRPKSRTCANRKHEPTPLAPDAGWCRLKRRAIHGSNENKIGHRANYKGWS